MGALAIPLLLLVGSLLAVQAAAIVQVSAATGNAFGASTLQLGIGAGLMLGAAALTGSLDALAGLADAEGWHLVGGLGSAIYITSGIALFLRLGAVVTVGLWIAGQMLASLVLDGFGWLGVQPEELGAPEAVGGVAVLVGAALIVRSRLRRERWGVRCATAAAGWRSRCWPARRSRSRGRSTPSCVPISVSRSPRERCRSWSQRPAWACSSPARSRLPIPLHPGSSRCGACRGGAGSAA
jgi:uncharacterized membrane protein YdcZ (DUF606 family)